MKQYKEPKLSILLFDVEDIMSNSGVQPVGVLKSIAENTSKDDKTILELNFTDLYN